LRIPETQRIQPARAQIIVEALAQSMDVWIEELEKIRGQCPGRADHLAASLQQARMSLRSLLGRD
jgi:hypothetical protein